MRPILLKNVMRYFAHRFRNLPVKPPISAVEGPVAGLNIQPILGISLDRSANCQRRVG
jgi:hypothetical protein